MESHLFSRIRILNIVKMATLSKATYRFNAIPIKIPTTFLAKMKKPILRVI